MSKYSAFSVHLSQLTSDSVRLSFADIERIIGDSLPASARQHQAWWANSRTNDSHTWAHLWLDAGWERSDLNLKDGWAEFRRAKISDSEGTTAENGEQAMLRSGLSRILTEYPDAMLAGFTDHPLANFIRGDLKEAVANASGEGKRLIFKGGPGMGRWARGPWVGIFNAVVTTGAQRGYYVCYLFREDMQGVYLSLNQGMTEAKEHYKSDAKTALHARAQNFRAMLGGQIARFPELTIDLAPSSPNNDTAFYEAGNICAAYYPANSLPTEAQLVDDLKTMLKLYEALILGETEGDQTVDGEDDMPPGLQFEDATRFRMHKRIERNASLAKKVKQKKGCTCEVCGVNFEQRYGPVGAGYIEAHHLKPIASLKGTKVAMDPETDFAVLCANCHRMVHRSGYVDDIQRFKSEHFHG